MPTAWNNIHGFERVSLCDWPGMSSSVIFLGGCNMHCPTCHNWNLAWHSTKLPRIPRTEITQYLQARKQWIDGVVITGGEATIEPGLEGLIRDLIDLDMRIKLDTNGMRPDVVAHLLAENLVDLFAVDVKGPYTLYPTLTGGTTSPEEAEANLGRVFELAVTYPDAFFFRCTHVPVLTHKDIEEARSYIPSGFTLNIQEYVPPRRHDAEADSETGRLSGNVVTGTDCTGDSTGTESQRH